MPEDTNTSKRQHDASECISSHVEGLLGSSRELTLKQVEVLYREYRAFYRNRKPFRMSFHLIGGHGEGTDTSELLAQLATPGNLTRWRAFALLACLRATVAGTVEKPDQPRPSMLSMQTGGL